MESILNIFHLNIKEVFKLTEIDKFVRIKELFGKIIEKPKNTELVKRSIFKILDILDSFS